MKVLIADKFEKAGLEKLQALGCRVTLDADLSGESLRDAVKDNGCQVLVVRSTKVTPDILEAGQALELVIRAGTATTPSTLPRPSNATSAFATAPGGTRWLWPS